MALKIVEQTKHVKVMETGEIRIEKVRLSYPHLFRPGTFANAGPDAKPKFSAAFLMPLATHKADIEFLRKMIKALAQTELKGQIPSDKLCLRNGSGSGKPEQEGHWVFRASESKRPAVVGKDRAPVTEEDGTVYGGCYVNAVIRLWAQSNQFGKRINANLLSVQFAGDGEAFQQGGTRSAAEDVFEEFETEEAGSTGDAGGLDDIDL